MNRRRVCGVTLMLVVGITLTACGTALNNEASPGIPLRTDGTPIPLGASNLVGKSLQEIGDFAQREAQAEGIVQSGVPEVKLVRPVKRLDLPGLGLECMPDSLAIEEPPYVLVVLKGDFSSRASMSMAILQ